MSSGTSSQVADLVGVGLHVRGDVVHVEPVDGGAPRGVGEAQVGLEGLEAEVEHPGGLVLARGDLAHDVGREALGKALEALLGVLEVVEAAVDVRDLGALLWHGCSLALDDGARGLRR